MVLAALGRVSRDVAHAKVKDGALLLDVRSEGEHASGALPGSKNIPVHALGARMSELDRGRAIVVYCASGMRSASAASVLRSKGFEVYDLGPASRY
ncbi:MAG: rhodanese-like domain-containing protein [Sandaracinaceae bacterium]|nr:rhodanese-like domain-containing protein [Sandaracinaceae bacterium]